ncbi:hypothetical protein [Streptomyces coerulescens]|uniref:Uncharacterized protein n=1 Tax=Streptomyces coerulescens TaxID=29304 RepID=A0ABW0CXA4_STRCD
MKPMQGEHSATLPPPDPFTSLAAHFGMLLGVADLEAVVGHAWAKMRLHNAWLHGGGVVWGFGISLDGPRREVKIAPGLALDDLGRELHLPVLSCLDLAKWFEENEEKVKTRPTTDGVAFDAHVLARFRACLDRPVPALTSPCDSAGAQTTYSRLRETCELLLVPGRSTPRRDRSPRLRRLLGLPGTGDAVTDAAIAEDVDGLLDKVKAAADADRPRLWLEAVRKCAALDTVDRRPADADGSGLLPGGEPGGVILGDLVDLRLITVGGTTTAGCDLIDVATRTSQVDTVTLVELASAASLPRGGA